MAPVVRALQGCGDACLARTCATAQHREMLDHAPVVFGVIPDMGLDLSGATRSAYLVVQFAQSYLTWYSEMR